MGPLITRDSSWVRQAFIVNKEHLDLVDQQNRVFTSASLKFTDTTPGGNLCINPPPQFTSTADIKVKGVHSASKGMGRYYSEAIDDNSQLIYMRFGVPAFNSLTTFFSGFYDNQASTLARTGRSANIFYTVGVAAGFIVSIISWKLLAVHLLGVAARFAFQKPSSKFYYLKPTMPLYWNAVQTMVNQISVNKGIVPRIGSGSISDPKSDQQVLNDNYEFTPDDAKKIHDSWGGPDIFREKGGIDVYAIAGKAQRLARKRYKLMRDELDRDNLGALETVMQTISTQELTDKKPDYHSYLARWFGNTAGKVGGIAQSQPAVSGDKSTTPAPTKTDANKASDTPDAKDISSENYATGKDNTANIGFAEFFETEMDDGSAFACFRVNATGHISESFSNSVLDSELSNKINNMSASSRSTNFTFAGGNISDGIIGQAVGGVLNAAKSLAAGIGQGLHISGLASLAGAAFVDIPKHWQSSSASLPRASYTINLVSPYGNPLSQLLNLYLPLSMLLAGALPLSTGKQSYTSPFLVELYDQGRCQTRLGMIDSISVTRGTGNLGFNNLGQALGIDVSFSIIDMSSIMHMPISQNFSMSDALVGVAADVGNAIGGAKAQVAAATAAAVMTGSFDDDTVFSDYMAVLASMGVVEQIYSWKKLKLQLTRKMANWDSWFSTSHFASWAGDTFPGRLMSSVYRGTARGSGKL